MNKNVILATAISAILAAPLANAASHGGSKLTVYGKAHVDVVSNDENDNWTINSNSSRLGFKGSEDLGNGMKVNFKYETTVNITDGAASGTFGSARNAYAGLSGDFGEVRIGRHDTPAKTAFYAAGNDRIGDSILDLNGSFGFSELRSDNVLAYIAPKMGGITILAAIIPGEGVGSAPTNATNNGLADAISLGAIYKAGPVKASFGYTDAADAVNGNTASLELMNLGGSYAVSDTINVGLQYQTVEAGTNERTAFAVTGEIGFGMNSLVLMFGNAEDDVSGATADSDATGLGVKHKFSKRTSGYVAFVDGDVPARANPWIGNGGSTANGSRYGIGLIHNF